MQNKKTILITGWTGYIGSHWVVAFEEAGYKTVIVDNLSNSSLKTLDWIEKILGYKPDFFEVDLRSTSPLAPLIQGEGDNKVNFINWEKVEKQFSLEEIFEKYDFDWVIHFAWLKAVWESCEKPLEYFDNNLTGSIKLFELMEKFWVKNIVFSSSATVYAPENSSPLVETMTTWNTSNPYWRTKFLIENILEDLAKFSWFRVANLRYFNPIWAHPSWEIWEDPAWIPNNLLPFIMKVATEELKQLQVFWNDYNTVDGTWVRDYIDVVDLIEGHLLAYSKLSSWFNIYNLWVGKWISVLEMINETEKTIWKKINYKIVERRAWDLAEVYCNPEKANKELNWKAKTSLEESIKNSWKFYNK